MLPNYENRSRRILFVVTTLLLGLSIKHVDGSFCMDLKTKRTYKIGDTWSPPGEDSCLEYRCNTMGVITISSCHTQGYPSCAISPKHEHLQFPHCCPEILCPFQFLLNGFPPVELQQVAVRPPLDSDKGVPHSTNPQSTTHLSPIDGARDTPQFQNPKQEYHVGQPQHAEGAVVQTLEPLLVAVDDTGFNDKVAVGPAPTPGAVPPTLNPAFDLE